MARITYLMLLFFVFAANAQPPGKAFRFSGLVKGGNTRWVYLDYIDANNRYVSDSCQLVNSRFHFTGNISGPVQVSFYQNQPNISSPAYTLLFLEPGNMKAVFQANHFKQGKITGSKTQAEYQAFVQQEGIQSTYETESIYRFIQQHPGSFVSAYLLMPTIFKTPLDSTKKYFQGLSAAVKNGTDGQVIDDFIRKEEKVAPGSIAPDFTQTDINGKSTSLKDFRGKYLLIDFWASWCGPCRIENPNLRDAYAQYGDKNFTILSVSIDKDAVAWKAAVQKDSLTWPQILLEEVEKNKMAQDFDVMGKGIPYNLLIGSDGIILAQNLQGKGGLKRIGDFVKQESKK
jgi:peroxiredoxin